MGSSLDRYDDTVVVDIPQAAAVVNTKRFKRYMQQINYSNVRCDSCGEWWLMVCIDVDKVFCPWCGTKCEVKKG